MSKSGVVSSGRKKSSIEDDHERFIDRSNPIYLYNHLLFPYLNMFTPVEGGVGALLIQAATSSYLHLEGKVVGFSSTVYGAVTNPNANNVSIVIGMFLSTRIIKWLLPSLAVVANPLNLSASTWAISGLLVGLGTSAGCGCTSGHMLSGLSRLRWRSFIATCTFFATGVITSYLAGNSSQWSCGVAGCYQYDPAFTFFKDNSSALISITLAGLLWSYVVLPKVGKYLQKHSLTTMRVLISISTGLQFGLGLFIAGMTDPSKVAGFLALTDVPKFDPSLAMIPLFTILPNIFLWKNWSPPVVKRPVLEEKFELNFSSNTERKFLIGNAIFGVGWGLAGVCPGPGLLAFFLTGVNSVQGAWIGCFLLGSFIEKKLAPYWK